MPRMIVNARGEEEPFELSRVVASILNAIRVAEYRDESEADHIAPMVEYALSRYFGDTPPSAEDVAHYIEQALRSLPGLVDVADAYVRGRQRRRELNAIEDGEAPSTSGPRVSSRSDFSIHGWERARLEAALVREHTIPLAHAQEIAGVIEMQVRALQLEEVSTSLLRELVDAQLTKHGVLAADLGIGQLSLPAWDIEQAIFPQEDAPRDSGLDTPSKLERFVARGVMRQFTWRKIHHADMRESSHEGRLAIADTDSPQRFRKIVIDTRELLREGAGLEESPFFADDIDDAFEAVERIVEIVSIAASQSAHSVVLKSLDTALAPLIRSKADLARLCRILRVRLGATDPDIAIALGFDALGGRMDLAGSISLLDAWLRDLVDDLHATRYNLETRVSIGEASLDDPSAMATLTFAAEASLLGRQLAFDFDRPRRSLRRKGLFGDAPRSTSVGEVVSAHGILNLVAPIVVDGLRDESAILESLGKRFTVLFEGLLERDTFVRRFHSRRQEGSPSAASALGKAWADQGGIVEVALCGLHEFTSALSGASIGEDTYSSVQDRLLGFLTLRLNELAEECGLEARFVGSADEGILSSIAAILRREHSDRYERMMDSLSRDLSIGTSLPAWLSLGAEERIAAEGRLHGLIKEGCVQLSHETTPLSREELVALIVSLIAARDAKVRSLRYQVSMRQCARCAIMAKPDLRVCPSCGSRDWRIPHGQKVLFAENDESTGGES